MEPPTEDDNADHIRKVHTLLTASIYDTQNLEDLKKRLMAKNAPTLTFVCRDLDCEPVQTQRHIYKKELVHALVNWVSVIFWRV
jgi:hypothetical protein